VVEDASVEIRTNAEPGVGGVMLCNLYDFHNHFPGDETMVAPSIAVVVPGDEPSNDTMREICSFHHHKDYVGS
jgi:hypothetical protein